MPNKPIPIIFGEVLFDCFPDGQTHLGGAPFNVAWHLHALGDSPYFISSIGDDPLGNEIRTAMLQWGMSTQFLQQHRNYPTGQVQVSIENGEPSYDIRANSAYDFIEPKPIPKPPQGSLIYHGSLALRQTQSRQSMDRLAQELAAPIFLDVNLRTPWWQKDDVMSWLKRARWAKLNHHELAILCPSGTDLDTKAAILRQQSELELLFVTCGADGAFCIDQEQNKVQVKPESDVILVDTVGAGDAFTSVLIHGLLHQWSVTKSMMAAQTFASAIVGIRGAVPAEKDFYTQYAVFS